ncbi:Shedu immune nuclease family protein [Gimesia chilikensis]|uniref:Shedu protein SduA C-terminal domain-containing protein n=1 Tax=Gimesia chilikensis TaxID=2605989 RepID=A0A517PYF0_9PLAN|nr:Shedu immune nuclease family protein [Gimesia chilikensis]QDT24418.1 hypothetical protein HG66A1_62500 [Gimesia chilikensis]
MAKKKNTVRNVVEKRREDGTLLYWLDRDKKIGEYNINTDSSQYKHLKKVELDGFSTFPKALYPTGFGFKVSGGQLVEPLHSKYGNKLLVVLSATQISSVKKTNNRVTVTINANKLQQINREVSDVKRTRRNEITTLVQDFLIDQFPKEFTGTASDTFKYRPNKIAEMLADQDVVENLSDLDRFAIQAAFPDLVEEMEFSLRSAKKVKIVTDGINTSKKVYLDKIIIEFEKKLKGSSSENVWQKFLHDHILTLLNTYAHVIEKQSVELDGKYPDFMLIDAYGYLDVYEIKKPQTKLLSYDNGRKNYYWHAEISRATTQTEKYMSSIQRHRYELESKLRKESVEAQIVRPRGFIIAGKRSNLNTEEMREDFRVLNDSLKNIDVICFDDLLDNLKALRDRLDS